MSNFEAAVEMSLNSWVASFPTEFDLPEPTEAYKKDIAKLMDKMRGDRYHKLTRNAARVILIAAIIMAIATATIAATVGRAFIVQKFKDHSTYSVSDTSGVKDVDDIKIGYIPEGFELTYSDNSTTDNGYVYEKDNSWINIRKAEINDETNFETEHKNIEKTSINHHDAILFENPDSNYFGIIWNDGTFIFTVEGNISKEKLISVAESIK